MTQHNFLYFSGLHCTVISIFTYRHLSLSFPDAASRVARDSNSGPQKLLTWTPVLPCPVCRPSRLHTRTPQNGAPRLHRTAHRGASTAGFDPDAPDSVVHRWLRRRMVALGPLGAVPPELGGPPQAGPHGLLLPALLHGQT